MGGCGMVGLTVINVKAGARSRVSAICMALMLLCILLILFPVVEQIPVASLVGVMFTVVYLIFEWQTIGWVMGSLLGVLDGKIGSMPKYLKRSFPLELPCQ